MGMMYMSSTETSINANYRDTQQAFFAMRAGLEERNARPHAGQCTLRDYFAHFHAQQRRRGICCLHP